MSKIAHLADLHIGFSHLNYKTKTNKNQRQEDFENAAVLAVQNIVKQDVDAVVIAGDLFHETNLYPSALSGAVRICEILNDKNIPVLVIGGNHDEAESNNRYNSLRFLKDHYNLNLFLEQGYYDLPDVRVHMVSYRTISRAQKNKEPLAEFDFSDEKANILVSHGYAAGEGVPDIPEEMELVIPDHWLKDKRFSMIMLGHVHHHGEIKPGIFYSGSTERRNFGEVEERPGFYIHEINADGTRASKSVFIDELSDSLPRPMKSISIDTKNMTVNDVSRTVEKEINRSKEGGMLRIVLENVSPELDRSKLRIDWEASYKDKGGFHLETAIRTRRTSELMNIKFKSKPKDVAKDIISFIDQHEKDKDNDKIKNLLLEVLDDARDRVISEGA